MAKFSALYIAEINACQFQEIHEVELVVEGYDAANAMQAALGDIYNQVHRVFIDTRPDEVGPAIDYVNHLDDDLGGVTKNAF